MEASSAGALAPLGDDLLVVGPYGRIARVRPPGDRRPASVEHLEGRVPMIGRDCRRIMIDCRRVWPRRIPIGDTSNKSGVSLASLTSC